MPEAVPPRPWLLPRDVLSTADVRRICGNVDRHTLLNWRAKKDFPEPWKVIRQKRGQQLELWDRRDIRAWLRANPPVS